MRRLLLALLLAGAACSAAAPPPRSTSAIRILFIGNSLTYTNDLPAMVQRLAHADGREVECVMAAYPGFSLADHLRDGRARRQLRSGRWDYVVLQQGPSSLPESREELIASAARWAKEAGSAKLALLSVWPSRARFGDFDRASESYRIAADRTGARWIGAGEAWRAAWKRDPSLPLYGPDGFHPSPDGTLAAAFATFATLIGPIPGTAVDPETAHLTAGYPLQLDAAQLVILRDVAMAQ